MQKTIIKLFIKNTLFYRLRFKEYQNHLLIFIAESPKNVKCDHKIETDHKIDTGVRS